MGVLFQAVKTSFLHNTLQGSSRMTTWFLFVLLFNLSVLRGGEGAESQDTRLPKCKNPKGKLWSTLLDKDCGQSVCKKKGNKGVWQQCPRPASQDRLNDMENTILSAINRLEEKIETQCGNGGEVPVPMQINGEWGPWGSWSLCDSETGMKKRTRKCDSPAPSGGGKPCPGSPTEEASCVSDDILFIGPTASTTQSELFLIPSFRKPKCKPPPFPSDYRGYHARMTPDGPLLCGGAIGCCTEKTCYLPTNNGSWTKSPSDLWPTYWSNTGHPGSSVEFEEGWWVAGEDSRGKTFIWDGSSWQNFKDLPKPLIKSCMAKINSTHIFLSGGEVYGTYKRNQESYIYSRATGFVQIANMIYPRIDHGCGLHDEKYIFVAGGGSTKSEYFDLESMTWHEGPSVNVYWDPKMISLGSKTYLIYDSIYELVTKEAEGEKSWDWVKVADVEHRRSSFDAVFMKTSDCKNWSM